MVHVNLAARTVTCKLVYFGPGLGGKTTNLEAIHERAPVGRRGRLLSVATEGDRTLFFDCMPLNLGTIGGVETRFKIYTVPGQSYYAATRRLVLAGADGVVFVADSSRGRMEENRQSLEELQTFTRELLGESLGAELPFVLQWNKRDVADALPRDVLERELNPFGVPSVEAIACEGVGVLSTLKLLVRAVLARYRDKVAPGPSAPTLLSPDRPPRPPIAIRRPPRLTPPSPDSHPLVPRGFQRARTVIGNPTSDPVDVLADLKIDDDEEGAPGPKPTPPVARTDPPVIGRVIAGCKVHTKLGEGGMGTVYRARHEQLHKDFVVKILKTHRKPTTRRVKRFQREARLAAAIEHPNIISVQDAGTTEDGLYYIVMQYVDGENLHERVARQGQHPPKEAARIVLAVTRALARLHGAGLIHRDVKAENVVVSETGAVKLIDFGLAKDLMEDGALTIPGAMIGTPIYMAPEIGRVSDVDGRADLYSLGLTYYYLLTGVPPFEGCDLVDIVRKQARLTPPETHAPGLPAAHRGVLARLLAWDRRDRYATAEALAADLELLIAGQPTSVAATSASWPGDKEHAEPSKSRPSILKPPYPDPGRAPVDLMSAGAPPLRRPKRGREHPLRARRRRTTPKETLADDPPIAVPKPVAVQKPVAVPKPVAVQEPVADDPPPSVVPAQRSRAEYALLAALTLLLVMVGALLSSWRHSDALEAQAARYESLLLLHLERAGD